MRPLLVVLALLLAACTTPSTMPVAPATAAARTPAASPQQLDHAAGGRGVRFLGSWAAKSVHVETTYLTKRWPTTEAIVRLERRTNLDLVQGRCPEITYDENGDPIYRDACVTAASGRHYLEGRTPAEVQLWSDSGHLIAADVAIDDHDTRKWSKAKRLRMLCAYIGRGAGLTASSAIRACR